MHITIIKFTPIQREIPLHPSLCPGPTETTTNTNGSMTHPKLKHGQTGLACGV